MTVPDLDALIAEVDRTCDTATGTAVLEGGQPNWLALLTTAAGLAGRLQAVADDLVEDYVEHCRMHGYTWSQIGDVLGVTRQAAQQRFLVPHREYGPEAFDAELTAALARTKELAVQRRNNYIGTEHLLAGLTVAPSPVAGLLAEHGVDVADVHHAVTARVRTGASRAAERIAFTPYARRALAAAHDMAGEAPIGAAHLLHGLADLGRGVAADVLGELGFPVGSTARSA